MRHAFPNVLAIPGLLALAALTLWSLEARSNHSAPELSFTNIASQAGLKAVTIYGGEQANRYLVETTGCGVALLDFDGDGWVDIYQVNGWRFDGLPAPRPQNHLYRNNRDGTFTDVTAQAGVGKSGWGQAVCLGDYDNDGDGTFRDVSETAGITTAHGTYGLGVLVFDFDNDGWPDIYVANDSNPSALYRNNHDGTFTDVGVQAGCAYSQDGKPQAGMGVSAGDYNRDGWLDIFKTNFSGDTSNLYQNTGKGAFEEVTFGRGVGVNTRFLGWGCGFVDLDNDGWIDIFQVNGHVYPEVNQLTTESRYRQRKIVYRNMEGKRFEDITEQIAGPLLDLRAGRGAAFGDIDNDGDIDVVVNNVNESMDLYRLEAPNKNHWVTLQLAGTNCNRAAVGARVRVVAGAKRQTDAGRQGGSC